MHANKTLVKICITTVVMFLVLCFISLSLTSVYASDVPDPTRKGSITVHKHSVMVAPKLTGDGLEMDSDAANSLGRPLANVTIILYKVKPDFEMKHTTTVTEARHNSDYVSEKNTSQDGIASWENLDHGYYVIKEIHVPDGYELAVDAIVSLPMGITKSGSGWNYDVHVYPKSISSESLVKNVVNKKTAYGQGQTVTWEIESTLPIIMKNGNTYGSFSLSDKLDNRLDYMSSSERIYATGGTGIPVELIPDQDYSEEVDSENKVTWSLNEKGIDKIAEQNSSGIRVTFDTLINERAIGATPNATARIFNGATSVGLDANGNEIEREIPDADRAVILLSGLRIHKIDSLNANIFLNDAEFKIAKSITDAENGNFIKMAGTDDDIVLVTGDNLETGDVEVGHGMFTGLTLNDSDDTSYFLVETKAPAGYVLRRSPIKITIKKDEPIGLARILNQKIGNPPIDEAKPTFPLPKTGGIGTTILFVLGALMIIVSAILTNNLRKIKNSYTDSHEKMKRI